MNMTFHVPVALVSCRQRWFGKGMLLLPPSDALAVGNGAAGAFERACGMPSQGSEASQARLRGFVHACIRCVLTCNAPQWQGFDDKETFEAMFCTLAMHGLKKIVATEAAHTRSQAAMLVARLGATALAARSDMCLDAFLEGASWYVQARAPLTPH